MNSEDIKNHNLAALANRTLAYRNESDPLFFKAQANEIDIQEWLDTREQIKQRFPYMEE